MAGMTKVAVEERVDRNVNGARKTRDTKVFLQVVTPEMAALWLTTDYYARQRSVREWHVRRLALAMGRREFEPGTLKFAIVEGKRFLIDGQHRLNAVVFAQMAHEFIIAEYHYATMEEVEQHYGRVDQGIKRLVQDAPILVRFRDEHDLLTKDMKAVNSGITQLIYRFEEESRGVPRSVLSIDERYRVTVDWTGPILDYLGAIAHGKGPIMRYLRVGGTASVGFVTMRHQKEKGKTFWERVAAMGGYEANSGEAHLVAFFLERDMKRLRAHETARWVARCWNAYYEGERVKWLRALPRGQPIRIAGTPYNGRDLKEA